MSATTASGLKVLLMTDLVGSVALQQRLGLEAYTELKTQHDALVAEVVRSSPSGEILEQTGDGFFVVFANVNDALRAALMLQSRIARGDWAHERPQVRIGVHLGEVTPTVDEATGHARYAGINVSLTARIMDLAGPGQILVSRPVYENALNSVRRHPEETGQPTPELRWQPHGCYRFKGIDEQVEVYEVGGMGIAPFKTPPGGTKARRSNPLPRAFWIAAAAVLALVAAGVVFLARQSAQPTSDAPTASSDLRAGSPRDTVPTIAVLPFRNFEGAENASFVAGMHDDILTSLAQVSQLQVLSRTSILAFADSRLTMRQIGAELGASHLVEGSVRRSDNRVRVVVQLIEASTDRNLWSETYDRELQDVFAIQSEIAKNIATQLVERLSPAEVAELERAPPTSNIAAYDAFNRARELWRQRDESADVVPQIVAELREALLLDPDFTQAGALLETIYAEWAETEIDAGPLQKEAARIAVGQFKRFAPVLGRVLQSSSAEAEPKTAAEWLAEAARQQSAGRFAEATASLERAAALEPDNRSLRMDLVSFLTAIGAQAKAVVQLEDWLERAPDDTAARLQFHLARAVLNPSATNRDALRAWLAEHPPEPGMLLPDQQLALATLLPDPALGWALSRGERAGGGSAAAPLDALNDTRLLVAYWAGKDALAGAAALETLTRLEAISPGVVATQPLVGFKAVMSHRLLGETVDARSIAQAADDAWIATEDAFLRLEHYPMLLALWSYVDVDRAVERFLAGPPGSEGLDLLPSLALHAPLMPQLWQAPEVKAQLAARPEWQAVVERAQTVFRPLP